MSGVTNGQTCRNCHFFLHSGPADKGVCRANPPAPSFPAVRMRMWCGKWKAAFTELKMNTGEWESKFHGRCDICATPKFLSEVHPGYENGWKVGYVCFICSPDYPPETTWRNGS